MGAARSVDSTVNDTLAIVDVETTGTSPAYHRIIEVAVLRVERGTIVRQFHSLVNPDRFISPFIEQITGITNDDVARAPRFEQIAGRLQRILKDATFVAHNAGFDRGFLQNEFARVGVRFSPRVLCTVRLSRKLFPHHRRHDLSTIIERHGLECTNRHRAMGDAQAVYQFLNRLREDLGEERVGSASAAVMRSRALPPELDRSDVDRLPESAGVYLFHGAAGETLYVGQSRNIKARVLAHFSASREREMCQQVARVEARPTAGELGALLLELHLIKDLHPIHNQVARSKKPLIVARRRTSRDGYDRLVFSGGDCIRPSDASSVMAVFKSRPQATRWLMDAAKVYRLCHKYLGLENPRGACFQYQLHRCDGACVGEISAEEHNKRFENAFARRRVYAWPFRGGVIIQEQGPDGSEGEVFLVDQWCLLAAYKASPFGQGPFLKGEYTFDYDSYKVLVKYMMNKRNRRNIRLASDEEMLRFVEADAPDSS